MINTTTYSIRVLLATVFLIKAVLPLVLIVNYEWQKTYITQMYCINKSRPKLKCNGKCNLAKQLQKSTDSNSDQQTPDKKQHSTSREDWVANVMIEAEQFPAVHWLIHPQLPKSAEQPGFPSAIFHPPQFS